MYILNEEKMKKITTLIFFCMLTLHVSPTIAQELSGNWTFNASPFNGGEENIPFTATVSSDNSYLACHADNFFTRGSKAYPMDWKIAIERNGEQLRLGWILDANTPASSEEFQEEASKYVIGGVGVDGTHRYIYLLSENINTQKLEGMTLWSDWVDASATTFTLPKTQQIYGVVSQNIPYNGAVGYFEIWASGKLVKTSSDPAGIREVASEKISADSYYDLQGRRLNGQPAKGLYIRNGKKYFVR